MVNNSYPNIRLNEENTRKEIDRSFLLTDAGDKTPSVMD